MGISEHTLQLCPDALDEIKTRRSSSGQKNENPKWTVDVTARVGPKRHVLCRASIKITSDTAALNIDSEGRAASGWLKQDGIQPQTNRVHT